MSQILNEMHEPILFGLSSKLLTCHGAHQPDFVIQCTKSSNSFLLIPMVHKHFENGIVVVLEVNLNMETSPNRKFNAMCKNQLLPKMAKSKSCIRPSHCLWLIQIHATDQNQLTCVIKKLIM